MIRLLSCSALGCALLVALSACDAGSPVGPGTLPDPTAGPPPAGLSAIDGRPIVQIDAADLHDDAFGRDLRAALVDRSETLLASVSSKRSAPDDAVLLRDVLATTNSKTGAEAPSTHIVITDGGHQPFLLTVEHHAAPGAAKFGETYVVLDPEVFYPDEDPAGESPVRTVPATALGSGEETEIVATAEGVTVDGQPIDDVLLVGVVPIVSPGTPGMVPPPPCDWDDPETDCGDGSGGGSGSNSGTTFEYYAPHPYLGLRSLRVNQTHDGGWFRWSDKQEVHFTIGGGDNYNAAFPQLVSRRFDRALWTNLDDWGAILGGSTLIPQGLLGDVQSTFNIVLADALPTAGEASLANVLWMRAADVDYEAQTYDFTGQEFASCSNIPTFVGCVYSEAMDFPLHFLDPQFGTQRSVMHEDDRDVGRFSRRSGEDWIGPVRTYSFATGAQAEVPTRLDASNHTFTTDDRVFTSSGLRGISQSSVQNRVSSSGLIANVDQLQWEFSYNVIDPSDLH